MKRILFAALVALSPPAAAFAQEAETPAETPAEPSANTLFPGVLDLPVIDGSRVPADCMFPTSLQGEQFHLACVVMTRDFNSSRIGAAYIGALGERGWRQGAYISGGMAATHEDADGCQQVMGIYPSNYPPGNDTAREAVIWFALARERQCSATSPSSSPQ